MLRWDHRAWKTQVLQASYIYRDVIVNFSKRYEGQYELTRRSIASRGRGWRRDA